jgi:MFS family permease
MGRVTKPQKARWATALFFILDGFGFGVWAGHIPVFKEYLHLSSLGLSEVLLALVVGSILTMPLAGLVIQRRGSRYVIWTTAATYILSVTSLAFAHTMLQLIVIAAAYGASKGALDVAINAQGVWIEQQMGKPIVSSFQGFWSAGGLFGASITSFALRHGGNPRDDFSRTAIVLVLWAIAAAPFLLQETLVPAPVSTTKRRFQLPDASLLRIAGIAFLGLFAEGAMADWSGVFLKSSVGVSLSQAAIGYAAFSISMAAGRFAGDRLIARFSSTTILRGCGLLLFCGLSFALALNVWWAAMAGFICAGLGVANIVSVIWGVAGRNVTVGTGPALAAVTTIGYFGFLAGPPLIGALATVLNVRLALVVVALFGVAIAGSARAAMQTAD